MLEKAKNIVGMGMAMVFVLGPPLGVTIYILILVAKATGNGPNSSLVGILPLPVFFASLGVWGGFLSGFERKDDTGRQGSQ